MSDLLEFRLLKFIIAIAETANFTRASERVFLAQPTLSQQIIALEEGIGIQIFVRRREGVSLTPAGQMLYSEDLDAEYLNVLETRTRTPFFQDVYVDGVRVMLILGQTGTGKSVHGNQMIALEQKYSGFTYIFDIGGSYVRRVSTGRRVTLSSALFRGRS